MKKFSEDLNIIAKDANIFLSKFFLNKKKYSYLTNPMKYGVFSGGKRIRSVVIVNTGKIFNIDYKTLITISAAIECVHSYSLMHDDLPAMDNDSLRRGKLTTHKKFNEFTAILAGSSLLTLAFEILSSKTFKISASIKSELIYTLAIYSGLAGLAGGQYFDLTYEGKKISKSKILNIQYNKTGKLFAFCCECAGIIKGHSFNKRKTLKNIGLDIGLLFQITDDLIDHRGDSKIAGKKTKKDKKAGKPTLISLIGYKKTLKFAFNLKNKISKKIKNYGIKSQDLLQSVEFILDRKF